MKRLLLILTVVLSTSVMMAQENEKEFNQWSIEVSGGVTKPSAPFGDSYNVRGMNPYQGTLAVRYMMNEKVGLRANVGYNKIEEDEEYLPFETSYYRATLEAVVNVGNVLEFSDFTNRFGLLFHSGGGYGLIDYKTPVDRAENDHVFNVSAGITPQFRITDRIAFFTDLTLMSNIGMNRSWDGTERITSASRRIDDGLLYNVSAGITLYLGENDVHADWYSDKAAMKSELEEMEERLAKIETDLIDSDQDGVPDYLDREPNTFSGVAVDTKGIAVDKNENGIPDEIETSLDQRYLNKSEYNAAGVSGGAMVKDLLDKGYVNVYFQFNSTKPETYSLEAINYLKTYMNENPSATAQLVGYADEIGNVEYNRELSERRAKMVYDILIASGVEEGRLTYTGNGEDGSVDKSSAAARQLVRRVTFKLNQ